VYLTEPVPDYGTIVDMVPGIRRIVARNPSLMTYRGTNTYFLESSEGFVVIDPGPEDDAHLEAVLVALDGIRPAAIIITHSHYDHIGCAAALRTATDAPILRMITDFGAAYPVDLALCEGDISHGLRILHTPGHAPDHICLSREDGILFSGDHVMSWSSSIVSPPYGDMVDYYASLRRLIGRRDSGYLPGHGPMLKNPQKHVKSLLAHRLQREDKILEILKLGRHTLKSLVENLYFKRDPRLFPAAERNVKAHLQKLELDGEVCTSGDYWVARGIVS
jgi:glyoxylase-like metal-dependent hydrolase (beta-lactamase superfamily II)